MSLHTENAQTLLNAYRNAKTDLRTLTTHNPLSIFDPNTEAAKLAKLSYKIERELRRRYIPFDSN